MRGAAPAERASCCSAAALPPPQALCRSYDGSAAPLRRRAPRPSPLALHARSRRLAAPPHASAAEPPAGSNSVPSGGGAASAGKGFGRKAALRVPVRGEDAAVAAAVRAVEGRRDVRPVDPAEAARGRLDFATVSGWGAAAAASAPKGSDALDALTLRSFSPGGSPADETRPFYEQLALRLQLLEARGELGAMPSDKKRAGAGGAAALPPFKEWRFSRAAYAQYLADVAAVHGALEAASAAQPRLLAWLAPRAGLAREAAARADAAAFAASAPPLPPPPPSPAAAAHASRIASLAADAARGDASAAARVAAHGYGLHVSHVSLGMRLGAKGAEQLALAQMGALSLYADYPHLPPAAAPGRSATPLAVLARAVDALGEALKQAEREGQPGARDAFLEELPTAVRATSALWSRLAGASL